VLNVSSVPDTRELLLAADVMVADYSSIIFDFALTRRPILFFVHDIEHYRDELRGMYIDLEAEAPGPMLRTVPELVEALGDVDNGLPARHREAYDRFVARHTEFDDGHAAGRAVSAFFGV
jgi:CDP-glycerol glycerophosphotransferase